MTINKANTNDFAKLGDFRSLHMLPFWLLVASLVRGTATPLMQCPYYQYTGAHFTKLRRMTG